MKLIVLGNNGSFPGRDSACSGYLIQDGTTNILIDCGNGVISRAQRYCKIEDLEAIVLSHLHRDHTSDMFVLRYAVETKFYFKTMDKPITVYAPSTPEEERRGLEYNNVYNLTTIYDTMEVNIKGLSCKFFMMNHPVETYGLRIEKDDKVLSYTADTIVNDNLKKLAANADLFLSESTATEKVLSTSNIPHLSAKQAAEVAKLANVKKLLLTHFWYEEERSNYLKEASTVFPEVLLAEEFKEYEV